MTFLLPVACELSPVMSIKLIVGLGNPGRPYEGTRHNVGVRVLKALSEGGGIEGVALFQPPVFMNQSGGPVAELARRKGLAPEEIAVVCDDFAIPLGSLRIRLCGPHPDIV